MQNTIVPENETSGCRGKRMKTTNNSDSDIDGNNIAFDINISYVHYMFIIQLQLGDKVIGTLITQDTGNGTITEDHVESREKNHLYIVYCVLSSACIMMYCIIAKNQLTAAFMHDHDDCYWLIYIREDLSFLVVAVDEENLHSY